MNDLNINVLTGDDLLARHRANVSAARYWAENPDTRSGRRLAEINRVFNEIENITNIKSVVLETQFGITRLNITTHSGARKQFDFLLPLESDKVAYLKSLYEQVKTWAHSEISFAGE